jgi:hypothetical protein
MASSRAASAAWRSASATRASSAAMRSRSARSLASCSARSPQPAVRLPRVRPSAAWRRRPSGAAPPRAGRRSVARELGALGLDALTLGALRGFRFGPLGCRFSSAIRRSSASRSRSASSAARSSASRRSSASCAAFRSAACRSSFCADLLAQRFELGRPLRPACGGPSRRRPPASCLQRRLDGFDRLRQALRFGVDLPPVIERAGLQFLPAVLDGDAERSQVADGDADRLVALRRVRRQVAHSVRSCAITSSLVG